LLFIHPKKICETINLSITELTQPRKQRDLVHAMALICYIATRICRIKGTEVGQHLVYSATAVSRAALKGQDLI